MGAGQGWKCARGRGARVRADLADGLNDRRERSKMTPGFWLKHLDGCWRCYELDETGKGQVGRS